MMCCFWGIKPESADCDDAAVAIEIRRRVEVRMTIVADVVGRHDRLPNIT